ncbi:hypothetical protein CITRIK5_60082 [Citricoccus sp. K5]|nr:hypothetical protein CITRIK5_60082 [Citricoccus sp. K5]
MNFTSVRETSSIACWLSLRCAVSSEVPSEFPRYPWIAPWSSAGNIPAWFHPSNGRGVFESPATRMHRPRRRLESGTT